jgi:hypothetical protein
VLHRPAGSTGRRSGFWSHYDQHSYARLAAWASAAVDDAPPSALGVTFHLDPACAVLLAAPMRQPAPTPGDAMPCSLCSPAAALDTV